MADFLKSATDFPKFGKVGDGFPQSRLLIFPKLVTDFPKIGDGILQNQWRISSKSVTDFLKVGGWFAQSRWQISSKSVTDFLKVGDGILQNQFRPGFELLASDGARYLFSVAPEEARLHCNKNYTKIYKNS